MMTRRLISACALLAMAGSAWAGPSLASVSAGWPVGRDQGVVRSGAPFPLRAVVQVDGPGEVAGWRLVIQTRDSAGIPCRTVFPLPELSPGRHAIPMVARHTGSWLQPLSVVLERADGSPTNRVDIAPAALRPLAGHQPLVLALGSKFPELDRMLGRLDNPMATDPGNQSDAAESEPYPGMVALEKMDLLPTDPSALLGVDLAVANLTNAFMADWMAPANAPSRGALAAWLADGGRLVLGVDPASSGNLDAFGKSLGETASAARLPAMAPGPQETRKVPVGSLPRWVASNLPPLAARPVTSLVAASGWSDVLAREPGPGRGPRPMLVQGAAGRGWVLVAAIPLEPAEEGARQEKEIWRGFWGKILADSGLPAARSHGSPFLDNLADTGVPVVAFGWVAIIILALGIMCGPLDHLLTARLFSRPAWTWITFSAFAVAATGGILASARLLRGDKPVERWFALVDIDSREAAPRAWGEVFLARVDPEGSRHDVTLSPTGTWFDAVEWRAGPVGPVTVEDRPRPVAPMATRAVSEQAADLSEVRGLLFPPGGEQVLAGRFSTRMKKSPIKASLKPSRTAAHLHGAIENHLPIDLSDTVLLHAGRMQALGDLPGRGGRVMVETMKLGDAGEASETWRVLMHQGAGLVEGGRVLGGREQARPAMPAAFQPFLFARAEAADAARSMGLGWDQSWRLRKVENAWRDEVVLVGRAALGPADLSLDGVSSTADPARGGALVRVFLPVDRSVEPTE